MLMVLEESRLRERRLRAVSTTLAVVFLLAGGTKLMRPPLQVDMFRQFGLPGWTLTVVGALEIIFAALTFGRSTRAYGAVGLVAVMVGAALTHVMTGVMLPMLFINAVLFGAAAWVVIKHRPTFLFPRLT